MNFSHGKIVERCQVLLVLSLYLFITLSNIFLISNLTFAGLNDQYLTLKTSVNGTDTKSHVERADKAIFKQDNKSSLNPLHLIVSYHSSEGSVVYFQAIDFSDRKSFDNKRYSYLTFLNLRI
ncbi:MAG: hypothetical protein ACXVAZ_12445 [Mucilaginibacter sp.]